jgi:hypothetical protein
MKVITGSYPLWRDAKVINTTDPEKLGRIQLKVYPELSGIPDDDCPWCLPQTGGVHGKSFGLPLVDQIISCIVWNRFWNEITFFPFNVTNPTEHLFDDFMKNIRPLLKDVPTDPEEEHLVVERFEDDFSQFHDTKNKQHGWAHPSGAHFTINELGDMFLWLIKMLTIHNGDDSLILEIDPEKQNVRFYQKGNTESETDGFVKITIHDILNLIVDKDVTRVFGANESTDVTGNSRHKSANTDLASDKPFGFKGGGVELGSGVLRPLWKGLIKARTRNPIIIAPVALIAGAPVLPIPIFMNMATVGRNNDMVRAFNKAIGDSNKVLK